MEDARTPISEALWNLLPNTGKATKACATTSLAAQIFTLPTVDSHFQTAQASGVIR